MLRVEQLYFEPMPVHEIDTEGEANASLPRALASSDVLLQGVCLHFDSALLQEYKPSVHALG